MLEGAAGGAPHAVQVADRFHLLVNLSSTIEQALEGRRSDLRIANSASDDNSAPHRELTISSACRGPPLVNSLGNPRHAGLRGPDISQLIGIGFCDGVALGLALGLFMGLPRVLVEQSRSA
jgi:hypothetical protein